MKILVIHATAGAGHKKAAEAIYNGIKAHTPHEAIIVDSLDYTNAFFKKSYPLVYVFLVTKLPSLWALFFWVLDFPSLQPLVRLARRVYNGLNAGLLQKFLKQEHY